MTFSRRITKANYGKMKIFIGKFIDLYSFLFKNFEVRNIVNDNLRLTNSTETLNSKIEGR